MNSRERVQLALSHQEPDRVPIDLGGTVCSGILASAYAPLCKFFGLEDQPVRIYDIYQMLAWLEEPVIERLGIDVVMVPRLKRNWELSVDRWKPWILPDGTPVEVPRNLEVIVDDRGYHLLIYQGKPVAQMPPDGHYFDFVWERSDPELNLPDLDKLDFYVFDDEELEFYHRSAERLYLETDKALVADFGIALGRFAHYEDWMITLATNPTYVREYYSMRAQNIIENYRLLAQAIGDRVEAIFTGQDFGTQRAEMISPIMFSELIAPFYKRCFDWIHEHTSWKVIFHSDGCIYNLIPYLIDAGVDFLNPVQFTAANMNSKRLKQEFGNRLGFWGGGVDTQQVLPYGTVEDVRRQVGEQIDIFAPGGGYVFSAIHNIQHGVLPENIVALFEKAKEHGEYPITTKLRPG